MDLNKVAFCYPLNSTRVKPMLCFREKSEFERKCVRHTNNYDICDSALESDPRSHSVSAIGLVRIVLETVQTKVNKHWYDNTIYKLFRCSYFPIRDLYLRVKRRLWLGIYLKQFRHWNSKFCQYMSKAIKRRYERHGIQRSLLWGVWSLPCHLRHYIYVGLISVSSEKKMFQKRFGKLGVQMDLFWWKLGSLNFQNRLE